MYQLDRYDLQQRYGSNEGTKKHPNKVITLDFRVFSCRLRDTMSAFHFCIFLRCAHLSYLNHVIPSPSQEKSQACCRNKGEKEKQNQSQLYQSHNKREMWFNGMLCASI